MLLCDSSTPGEASKKFDVRLAYDPPVGGGGTCKAALVESSGGYFTASVRFIYYTGIRNSDYQNIGIISKPEKKHDAATTAVLTAAAGASVPPRK
jgi:hypothetical protein